MGMASSYFLSLCTTKKPKLRVLEFNVNVGLFVLVVPSGQMILLTGQNGLTKRRKDFNHPKNKNCSGGS